MQGQIREQEVVAYWTNMAGECMIAPDTRMVPFRGWMRHEARTVAEIESLSRRLARQEWEKYRSAKVEEHLRSLAHRERIRENCKLRLARGCISPADEAATRRTLDSLDAKDKLLYKLIATEPDLSRASLVIERQEQPVGPAQWQGKRRGLADGELAEMVRLAQETK